jgi:hypothetical protein
LINRIIFGDEYRSLNSSLYSFRHSPVTSTLLSPNILKHPQPTSLTQYERPNVYAVDIPALKNKEADDTKCLRTTFVRYDQYLHWTDRFH